MRFTASHWIALSCGRNVRTLGAERRGVLGVGCVRQRYCTLNGGRWTLTRVQRTPLPWPSNIASTGRDEATRLPGAKPPSIQGGQESKNPSGEATKRGRRDHGGEEASGTIAARRVASRVARPWCRKCPVPSRCCGGGEASTITYQVSGAAVDASACAACTSDVGPWVRMDGRESETASRRNKSRSRRRCGVRRLGGARSPAICDMRSFVLYIRSAVHWPVCVLQYEGPWVANVGYVTFEAGV